MSIKRQTLWSMAPLVVISMVNIFSVPLFLHSLGSEMYALWFYVITFSGIFGFADMGLGVAVGRYIGVALGKNDHEAVRSYWGTGNLILIPFLALVALAFIGIGAGLGPKWFNVSPDNANLLRACFVAGGFGLFFAYYGQYWLILSQAHLDFKFIGLLQIGTGLLQVIPCIALAFLTQNPLVLILWSVLIGLLQLGVFVWHTRRNYNLGFNLRTASLGRAREMAVYIGKNFAGLISGSFFGSIDRVILGKFAPAADFNPYTISANLGGRLQGLGTAVMGPVFHNTNRAVGNERNTAAKIYNETFSFVFEWYLLAAIWLGLWHPALLRLWLGEEMGMRVAPLLTPLVVACCISAIANISGAQLASLNRLGTAIGFSTTAGVLAMAGVWIGWHVAGVIGAAYGFLFSRIPFLAQDLFTIRLLKAGGWLDIHTWLKMSAQGLVGAVFALSYLALKHDSYWLLIPAALHGGLTAAWLLRHQLRKFIITVD
jgi:O-antigen/teichoic acid export membrane protein